MHAKVIHFVYDCHLVLLHVEIIITLKTKDKIISFQQVKTEDSALLILGVILVHGLLDSRSEQEMRMVSFCKPENGLCSQC